MLKFKTEAPGALLKKFEDAVGAKGSGKPIDTWDKVSSGPHKGRYTHTSERQGEKAFFGVEADEKAKELRFFIRWPTEESAFDKYIYAYYHGHLTETFLHHFRDDFSDAVSTAKPQSTASKPAAKTTPKA